MVVEIERKSLLSSASSCLQIVDLPLAPGPTKQKRILLLVMGTGLAKESVLVNGSELGPKFNQQLPLSVSRLMLNSFLKHHYPKLSADDKTADDRTPKSRPRLSKTPAVALLYIKYLFAKLL